MSRGIPIGAVLLFLSTVLGCGSAHPSDGGNTSDGTGGGTPGGGGTASGGASTGGGSSAGGASGGVSGGQGSSGGSSSSGGTLGLPFFESELTSLDGFTVAPKSALIPGATATTTKDSGASDGNALKFTVPGNASFGPSDYDGPGAHAIEVVYEGAERLYGRYEFNVSFPSCGADEELVSGLFTYFNDGSDADSDGVADNSEIDIEHLCGQPEYLWLTVWTDYAENPSVQFRRTSRVVNLRTGEVQQTSLGGSSWGGLSPAGTLPFAIPNFPLKGQFYNFGFEWRSTFVRYFVILDGEEKELWKLEGEAYVPQRAAALLMNLWHPSTHWMKDGPADFPAATASFLIDSVRFYE